MPSKHGLLALLDGDLLIAGYHARSSELSRYRLDGHLVWRQSAPLGAAVANGGTREFESGMRLAADERGRALWMMPDGDNYSFAEIDEGGNVSGFAGFSWTLSRRDVKAQVAFDGEGRAIFGMDGEDNAYSVLRCHANGCRAGGTLVGRERTEYYPPDLYGLAVDDESRIHVLTRDGSRDEPRLLLDRYSVDMSRRETFVVDEGDEPILNVRDIKIGPSGDIYYWDISEIGRIRLR